MTLDEVIQFLEARQKGLQAKRRVCLEKGLFELAGSFEQQANETAVTLEFVKAKTQPKKLWYSKLLFWRKK